VFGIHPPVGILEVRVVNKDTGELIPDVRFPIMVPKRRQRETSSLAGTRNFELPPDTYEDITVDLGEPALAGRYKVTERGKATVTVGKTAVATVKVEVKQFRLTSVDHHFVPGTDKNEHLRIKYDVAGFADSKVLVQVLSDQHNPAIVFERELTAEEKSNGSGKVIEWDGKTNCTAGPLVGKYVNPLLGKLKVRLSAPDSNLRTDDQDQTATRVLVHSLKLMAGSYVADSRRPPAKVNPIPATGSPQWANHLKWVQYQLNSLGYFAGAVDGTLNAQTKRAIKRYTYEMVNSTEHDRADDPAFVTSLNTYDLLHMFMSDWDVIEDKAKSSKVFIQHNYFFHTEGASGTGNWNKDDGHWHKESDYGEATGGKLDRFEVPLETVITLESRNQLAFDPNHAGVSSPQAVGELEVEWSVIDPPEDLSVLPGYVANTSPTRAVDYINAVRANVTGVNPPTAATGGDNCPQACGGFSTDFFVQLLPAFAVRPGASPLKTISKVHQDAGTQREKIGATAVLFRGSHIGGDNFIIKASLTFDGKPNRAALERDHTTFQNAPALDAHCSAQTGTMTVWRKRRVSAVVNWSEMKLPEVIWDEIVEAFRAAFLELDVSNVFQGRIDHFVTNQTDASPYLDAAAAWLNRTADRAKMVFTHKHMMPFPTERGNKEKDDAYRNRVNGEAVNFNALLTRITLGSDTRKSVGEWLSELIGKARRPGNVVLRAVPFSGITLTRNTGFINKTTKVVEADVARNEGSSCTGMGGGVAYICEGYRKQLKDGFLTAHEIGHCSYLSHPFQQAVDHDSADTNCTMYYLHSGQKHANRPSINLAADSPNKPKFCGKCLLKLRGWKVKDPNFAVTPQQSPPRGAADPPPPATPTNPVMEFVEYQVQDGKYTVDILTGGQEEIELKDGATDPRDTNRKKIVLGPLRFLHKHRLTWKSSDEQMNSLTNVQTREYVTFKTPTQALPFSHFADPDQEFCQVGSNGNFGKAEDDHSVMLPALICMHPLREGKLIGEQRYQYRLPGGRWENIPQAAFLLEKSVYKNPQTQEWVFKFVKSNWELHNPNPYRFEIHYKIGPAPFRGPAVFNTPYVPIGPNGYVHGAATIYRAGAQKGKHSAGVSKVVTLKDLEKMGVLAKKPWL
jgi:hypothetical protein